MDSFLITLVIVVIAALSNWLQHRAQAQREEPPQRPDVPPRPIPPVRRVAPRPVDPESRPPIETTLEREIRRLLGEEPPPPAPAPAPPPPPVFQDTSAPPRLDRGQRPLPPRPIVFQVPSVVVPSQEERSTGFQRAQHLHEDVAERLRRVEALAEKHGKPRRKALTESLNGPAAGHSAIWGIRHNREAARNAFVASLVFGPPKGLES
jgi:type IV secretory pathway VirB10-like protein